MERTFAERLNRLFDLVRPPGRGPRTAAEAIAALRSQGLVMSAPYLSQLRSGQRTNPSSKTMAALASFFGIEPAYFTDDGYYQRLDRELDWLELAQDDDIRRVASAIAALPPEHRHAVVAHVERLRQDSSLEPVSADFA